MIISSGVVRFRSLLGSGTEFCVAKNIVLSSVNVATFGDDTFAFSRVLSPDCVSIIIVAVAMAITTNADTAHKIARFHIGVRFTVFLDLFFFCINVPFPHTG